MNKADLWLGNDIPTTAGNTEIRAKDTARTIAARPSKIIVRRYVGDSETTTQLAPQTVRLEVAHNIRMEDELRDAMVAISRQYVIVIGYKDHPTIPNTNLQRADRFYYLNREWEIVNILDTFPGRLLASAQLTP